MLKTLQILLLSLIPFLTIAQTWEITELPAMPEAVSNNAVVEGFIDGIPYIYSFGGIDDTKIYSGIHLKSWRYNTETQVWESIPPLPDVNGKIAAGASRIGNIIYIIGGYSVFSNGNEVSSNKIHRYDIVNNVFLEDGAPIPVATDDHVQTVWRDSLIYVTTGWNNTTNIANVQIYNPSTNEWSVGTSLPNTHTYKSFGASGVIVKDTIFYFGGASATFPSGNPFRIQGDVRKGVINPLDPTDIQWSVFNFGNDIVGYRMGATKVYNTIHWLGGSETTYNFDGIAYNGSGGVPTANRNVFFDPQTSDWMIEDYDFIPMDLRGIASVHDTLKYIVGGMEDNQTVSNRVFQLNRIGMTTSITVTNDDFEIRLFPNPVTRKKTTLQLEGLKNETGNLLILNQLGQEIHREQLTIQKGENLIPINLNKIPKGMYIVVVNVNGKKATQRMIVSY